MSEELRHRFNRLTFYTLLLAFLSVSMTFIIFSSVAQSTLSCPPGQFVNFIGTSSDSCATPAVQLGQWTSFPNPNAGNVVYQNGGTSGIACSVGILTNKTFGGGPGDNCELFNTRNYEAIVSPIGTTGQSAISIDMSVGCVSPAVHTSQGSVLYLQYANYTASTNLWENTTNFVFVPGQQAIYIDNTNGWDCPGTLQSTTFLTMPVTPAPGNGFIFRVVGVCGCNSTTVNAGNPILSSVSLLLESNLASPIYTSTPFAISTTGFRYQGSTNLLALSATNVNIQWIATNSTVFVQSGSTSAICTIAIGQVKCSSSTITFPIAFIGTPHVVTSVTAPFAGNPVLTPLGSVDFFRTHVIQA